MSDSHEVPSDVDGASVESIVTTRIDRKGFMLWFLWSKEWTLESEVYWRLRDAQEKVKRTMKFARAFRIVEMVVLSDCVEAGEKEIALKTNKSKPAKSDNPSS